MYRVQESKSKLEPFYRLFRELFAIFFGPRLNHMFEQSLKLLLLIYPVDSVIQPLNNRAQLPNNSSNQMTSQNPKWRCTGNLKAKIGDNLSTVFVALEWYFRLAQ